MMKIILKGLVIAIYQSHTAFIEALRKIDAPPLLLNVPHRAVDGVLIQSF